MNAKHPLVKHIDGNIYFKYRKDNETSNRQVDMAIVNMEVTTIINDQQKQRNNYTGIDVPFARYLSQTLITLY